MVQGKNSKSYKKQNTDNQNQPHTGFKNLVFGHQFASAGETIIPFDGLVTPTDWPQAGLINPTSQTLLAAQLQVFKGNITVTSSARGIIQKSEYVVRANAIEFLNIESLANEVFEVEVADLMISGNLIVDLQTIRVEGELQDTETDFNMGYEFDVLKEEIIVFRDGIQMFRSDNNDSSGATGNYYYLDTGNGRASVIRFFEPVVGVEPVLIATTGGRVDSPNVSTFQEIEKVQGQIDAMVPTLAALAGVPETDFQSSPNHVDLKVFGDKLLNLEKILDVEVPIKTAWTHLDNSAADPYWNGTIGNGTFKLSYRRNGQYMELIGSLVTGSTTTWPSPLAITLPESKSADSNFFITGSIVPFGESYALDSGTAHHTGIATVQDGDKSSVTFYDNDAGSSWGSVHPFTWNVASADRFTFNAKIPIDGWDETQPISDLI